ncbi:AHH domain-containing protein [Demequina activiva]|uniref:AHH domain-containing protein n=1 Tax=Demequina activiva TaxID=1582364 RepID=UPI0019440259|nr:AHH domain-containing protein [Demequina activiva]
MASRQLMFAHVGDLDDVKDDLLRYAFVALNEPAGSMTPAALVAGSKLVDSTAAAAMNDVAACSRVAPYLTANARTRSTAGDFWLACSAAGLGEALIGLAGIVSISVIMDILFDMGTDPDAPIDGSTNPDADCYVLTGVGNWCTSNADDPWLNPGPPTAADYDGAVNSPTAYSIPGEPWDPKPLRPRFTYFDGTEAWSCDGIPGEPRSVEVYALEDGQWKPQAGGAGSRPPVNCMFLDENGDLLLDADGNIDTSVRDATLDALLRKDGLENTYERHHIVTKYANSTDPAKVNVVKEMNGILARRGLTTESDMNLLVIPHEGPHPPEYHNWVLSNLQEADAAAGADDALFAHFFTEYITSSILEDPSIVLKKYWECRR